MKITATDVTIFREYKAQKQGPPGKPLTMYYLGRMCLFRGVGKGGWGALAAVGEVGQEVGFIFIRGI